MEQLGKSLDNQTGIEVGSGHSVSTVDESGPCQVFFHVNSQLLVLGQIIIQSLVDVGFFVSIVIRVKMRFVGVGLILIKSDPSVSLDAIDGVLHIGIGQFHKDEELAEMHGFISVAIEDIEDNSMSIIREGIVSTQDFIIIGFSAVFQMMFLVSLQENEVIVVTEVIFIGDDTTDLLAGGFYFVLGGYISQFTILV